MLNISRSKGNQAMKYGQSIEYNMRNIFLEKSYIKCGGKISPRSLPKNSKLSISLDQQSDVLYSLLLLYAQVERSRLRCRPLAFTSYKAFSKTKKRSGTSLPASFSA